MTSLHIRHSFNLHSKERLRNSGRRPSLNFGLHFQTATFHHLPLIAPNKDSLQCLASICLGWIKGTENQNYGSSNILLSFMPHVSAQIKAIIRLFIHVMTYALQRNILPQKKVSFSCLCKLRERGGMTYIHIQIYVIFSSHQQQDHYFHTPDNTTSVTIQNFQCFLLNDDN